MSAETLRAHLLANADLNQALVLSNRHIDQQLNAFNDDHAAVADSLVARALFARGMLRVAGAWYANLMGVPLEAGLAAIRSIMDDPPGGIRTVEWSTEGVTKQ